MLTARDEESDRVAGFELGADDYVTKPFSPLSSPRDGQALLRRSEPAPRAGSTRRRRRRSAGARGDRGRTPGRVDRKEFDLLTYMLENAGIVVSRDQLLDRVWGLSYAGGTRTVDVHVAQLPPPSSDVRT